VGGGVVGGGAGGGAGCGVGGGVQLHVGPDHSAPQRRANDHGLLELERVDEVLEVGCEPRHTEAPRWLVALA